MTIRLFMDLPIWILLILNGGYALLEKTEAETLPDYNVTTVSLLDYPENEAVTQKETFASASNAVINITDIPSHIAFLIVQIHTYQYNVTLSYDRENLNKVSNRSIFGSNIGLFVKTNDQPVTQVFLKNDNVHEVNALIAVVGYTKQAPIPGGCNMEFNIEVAPYQKLMVDDSVVTVDLQPASLPMAQVTQLPCEKRPIKVEIYHMYLPEQDFSPETYFNAIENMLSVEDVLKNGHKIPPRASIPPVRRIYSAYHGTGSVYAAVAIYGNYSTAYVPAFTYGCNYLLFPDDCRILNDTFSKVLCGVVLFLGAFSVFLGHRYHKVEVLLPVMSVGAVLGYGIAIGTMVDNPATYIGLGIIASFFLPILLLFLCCCNYTVFTLLMPAVSLGFLSACMAYHNVSDSVTMLESDWIFWPIFFAILLTTSIVATVATCLGTLASCAIFGSYLMILPIDYYIGSSLKYIVINFIRRATVPEFKYAVIHPPFEAKEIGLLIVWIILALLRVTKQFCATSSCCPCSEMVPLLTSCNSDRQFSYVQVNSEPHSMLGKALYKARVLVYLRQRQE